MGSFSDLTYTELTGTLGVWEVNRELKQQRRGQRQKRHLKSEFTPLQTLSRLFHLVYFVKCWQMFLELNSKGLYQSSGKEKKVVVSYSCPPQMGIQALSRCSRATTAKKGTKKASASLLLKLPNDCAAQH